MKFVLAPTNRYWWPVKVSMPHPSKAGASIVYELKLLLEPPEQDVALAAHEDRLALTTLREVVDHDRQQLLSAVKDWADVIDEDKQPVSFSAEAFGTALQQPWFRDAVQQAYQDSLSGGAARRGN